MQRRLTKVLFSAALFILAMPACKPAATADKSAPKTQEDTVTGSAAATTDALPSGWPWGMLRLEGRPVQALETEWDPAFLETLEVQNFWSFSTEGPPVHLYVYAFADQSKALAASPVLKERSSARGRPHYPETVINGAYLLIAGMPGDKPPSPEMIQARDAYLESFAGEE